MKTPTHMKSMNAADFLKAWENDSLTEPDSAYVVEGGPGEFMLFTTSEADTFDEAVKQAKEDKAELGFEMIQVRETKTGNVVYRLGRG